MPLAQAIGNVVSQSLVQLGNFVPQFIGGLIILSIGLIVAAVLRRVVLSVVELGSVEKLAEDTGVASSKTVRVWTNFLAELVRWATIIVFLVPTAESWGITAVSNTLNQLLFYLPNVFVAVIVGFVGVVIANLVHDAVKQSVKGVGGASAGLLSTVARYAILFFTGLIVLNQLGIAADLIRILFTGIVAMLAISGGLAFGLGGQETARDILRDLQKRVKK